jgi:predicted RNA binding protein YcfA (HicA-like mRNA interferase family)
VPLRPLPYREVKRKLEAAGFREVGQRGSHVKFAKTLADAGDLVAIVPHHREVAVGTIRGILRQTDLTEAEWSAL